MRERITVIFPAESRPTAVGGQPFVAGERFPMWAHARDASGREIETQDTDIAEHDVVFRIAATPKMLTATPACRLEARGHDAWNITRISRAPARGGHRLAWLLIYAKRREGTR